MIVIKINYASVLPFVNVSYEQSNVYAKVVYGTGTEWGDISGTLSNQTDLQNALNAKQNTLTLTTTGTSGASTLIGSTLNIPQYADAVTSVFGRTGAIVSTEGDYTLTQLGDVTLTSPTNGQVLKYNGTTWVNNTDTDTGLTSVGLTMPSAFTVSNSPLTSNGTIGVTGAGTSAQYIRGDGQLANFPSNGGGGSAFNYYLNGSVSQGTFGGDVYYEMNKTPVIGGGTNFTRTNAQGNGYIASFLTDAGDPSLLNIPGGNWNLEFYFQSSASGGSPQFYGELYKVSASNVFTLVASGSTNPEGITNGTSIDQYFTSIPVPQTSLLVTDRLAIRIYVITDGRTITLHTENSNLCEVLTTFSTGLNALNGLTAQVQYFATGTSGTDFAISSATDTHTFNLPTASATNRGALSSADWTTFNNKQNTITNPVTGTGTTNYVARWTSGSDIGVGVLYDNGTNVGIGTTSPAYKLHVSGSAYSSLGLITQGYTLAASGFNIEMGIVSGYAQINSYNRTTSAFGSLRLDGSNIMLNSGSGGNVLIGTTTDAGFKLYVNGTTRLNGSTTFGTIGSGTGMFWDNTNNRLGIGTNTPTYDIHLLKNQNAITRQIIENTTIGTASRVVYQLLSDVSAGNVQFGKTSSTFTPNKIINSSDAYINNVTAGDISILNDFATGKIKFAGGGASTAQMTLTAAGRLLIGTTTENSSALLNVTSTTQGFLPPRMTTTEKNAIGTPAAGLIVYDTTLNKLCVRTASAWETITSL